MTHLRKMLLEELERRNYSAGTIRYYVRFVSGLRNTSASRRTSWARIMCAPTRAICSSSGS